MGKIKILDRSTANKIAAGEIVEGPYSVVKELIENSLDAQANSIEVEIKEGGLSLIKVTDNGVGMGKDDAFLAFERHATSKISDTKDLFNITTFGFRGEALPSIASVSSIILSTKEASSSSGLKIKIVGGIVESSEEIAMNQGTSIEVRNLFFNTPARRKFLKGIGYETGRITELVTKYSLGHPGIRFKLISNQRVVYDTAGLESVELRLNNIYGEELENKFLHVTKEDFQKFSIEGWLAPVSFSRNTRNQQTIFVNGRLIKSYELSSALDEVYHTLLPKGRFPIAVVHLQVENTNLDVNIHPAKIQIKVFNIDLIQEKLINLFRKRLLTKNIDNYSSYQIKSPYLNKASFIPETKIAEIKEENANWETIKDDSFIEDNFLKEEIIIKQEKFSWEQEYPEKNIQSVSIDKSLPKQIEEKVNIKNILELTPIGQLNNSFILAQNPSALYIIDQHTAHERVLYEKFLREEQEKIIVKENLLIPVILTLSGKQEGILLKNILLLNDLGFIIESFGSRTYLLRSLPWGLKTENIEQFFYDLLDQLDGEPNMSLAKIKEKIIITAACKGAVKANQKLTNEEIIYLFMELAKVNNPHTCPHGRPIIHRITMQELYKVFQRGEFQGGKEM